MLNLSSKDIVTISMNTWGRTCIPAQPHLTRWRGKGRALKRSDNSQTLIITTPGSNWLILSNSKVFVQLQITLRLLVLLLLLIHVHRRVGDLWIDILNGEYLDQFENVIWYYYLRRLNDLNLCLCINPLSYLCIIYASPKKARESAWGHLPVTIIIHLIIIFTILSHSCSHMSHSH